MAYTKTNWQNNVTPINDTNLNHIEQGIYDNDQAIGTKQDTLIGTQTTGQNIKEINGNSILGIGNINLGTPQNSYSNSQTDSYSCDFINGTVLYSNTNGTNADFTLDESIAGYRYIQIEYTDNNKDCYRLSNLLSTDNCFDNLDIWGGYSDGSGWHFVGRTAFISFNGTSATWTSTRCGLMDLTSTTQTAAIGNYIYITKVIGYK